MLNRASRTASQVALFRALESARPHDRIFDDPLAVRFLPPGYRVLARLARVRPVGRRLEAYIDTRWSGPRASAVARTRLIDDLVSDAGARQALFLGAGYDSRAYRLDALAGLPVFEIDHPATQAAKRDLLRPAEAGRVHFVGVDLLADDLAAALRGAGVSAYERTVVVWEGVTNYLTADAVDRTLRQLAELLAAGSRIIFTYIDRGVLTGSIPAAGEWHAAVTRQGEPWTFGFDPADLEAYLGERGLRLTLDMSTRDAAERYLSPLGRHEPAATFYRVAQAEVR
ncbi:class I SAM-dependent methyltransferase [Actinoplanes sp. TBRC 11911]|uniref:class I SAM-dependent methyltransferase n=1 Tax=Actinoplanes sp. TBRC 11911 TaxID=2729386 RepID=UPI00145F4729|nr:class I SAM-dependent methyltransferase [Actinoplanes sp. TBRC 11911]NMO55691.1 class I SAM-dependent methyltransferase [Actinoplanes sp. TBRC 11911]